MREVYGVQGACPSATQSLLARQDARALAEADAKLPASGGQQLQAAAAQQKRAAIITAGRSVLDKLSRLKVCLLHLASGSCCQGHSARQKAVLNVICHATYKAMHQHDADFLKLQIPAQTG